MPKYQIVSLVASVVSLVTSVVVLVLIYGVSQLPGDDQNPVVIETETFKAGKEVSKHLEERANEGSQIAAAMDEGGADAPVSDSMRRQSLFILKLLPLIVVGWFWRLIIASRGSDSERIRDEHEPPSVDELGEREARENNNETCIR